MTKQTFIKAIEAIKKQYEYDKEVAKNLSKVFPNAFEANLLPQKHFLSNILMKILQEEMNDISLIELFCWNADFGNKRLRIFCEDKDVYIKTPEELYDFLKNNKQ
ncbi:hypothetical protein OKE68_10415 [Riemerella anatipestifer]|uniref:Uncharacterized protein n=2 Tax=Riemerella anatipestifer TaxID=34085 RepID=A0AAP3EW72_RIEAN|nr:hypothetical protein [Riemerella anatipestifer]MBT0572484.1 hypothetical protein [Riemerella anatipestifer]MBT0573675.1 hypothetical protein [Riemerella anatipestifer]MCU7560053.1 hypothetical protein [Riemerella anatipestifer]MCW0524725.1 hypothetical protein [Riemerella anatipestifer]MDR7797585.1 hypothetical protein [Riemerella anatipestifer]